MFVLLNYIKRNKQYLACIDNGFNKKQALELCKNINV